MLRDKITKAKNSELVCLSYVTVPSYEGNQPFIYVYYAEEDTRLALPVLVRLYNEGLRMWSWNGCETPTEVRASQRISSCAALLIFLSDNLGRDIDRGYFEAMEALRCNKVKYFVRLSDVELPFDWGRSDNNVVIDYARSNEAAFWLSVYDIDVIERCRGVWPSQPLKSGMSVFDSIDSGELSDEYSSILKIIGESPTLDRSGVPINAEDIALFAGAGESDEKRHIFGASDNSDLHLDELNRQSIEDLFGMLDEISVSTRQRAEEMRLAAEQRRQEQQAAAMKKASLPFQHDVIKHTHSDEPPVPALSFKNTVHWTVTAARDMFGENSVAAVSDRDFTGEMESMAQTMFGEGTVGDRASEKETDVADVPIIIIEDEQKKEENPSFEEFIDELTERELSPAFEAEPVSEETGEEQTEAEISETEETAEEAEETEEEPEEISMPTQPKTVEIEEERPYTLLPPASGSLTGFTLPDDNYIAAQYVEIRDEGDEGLTAAERAAAAEESRKLFESALEKAAYSVSGRIVARHSNGEHSVGLRVRKPVIKKAYVKARVKPPVKVSPALVQRTEPVQTEEKAEKSIIEPPLSRAERRAMRRTGRKAMMQENMGEESIAVSALEFPVEEVPKKVSVTPEPIRAVPTQTEKPEAADENTDKEPAETAETVTGRRKKRHPHNSSGLIDVLRSLRAGTDKEIQTESEADDSEES